LIKKAVKLDDIDSERWRAARWAAYQRGISIRRLFWEWVLPRLNELPPAPNGAAGEPPEESTD